MERFDYEIDLEKISPNKPMLVFGDSLTVIRHLKPSSVDLIIDDMGYPDLEKHRSIGTTTRLKESKSSSQKFYSIGDYTAMINWYKIILKRSRHLYIWRPSLNQESLQYWFLLLSPEVGLLSKNKFKFRKAIPCIKNYLGMGYSYRSSHERLIHAESEYGEEVVFAVKIDNKRLLNDLSLPDYFDDPWKSPHDKTKVHVSEKPTTIYQKIMMQSTNEKEIVLEPFAGSFQSAMANIKFNLKRRVIGIEHDKVILEKTLESFKDMKKELEVVYIEK